MIDIHSHILYGMDDGAISLGETIDMLKIAVYEGIDTVIATPSYRLVGNNYTKEELISRYEQVVKLIKKENIPITLSLGNQVHIDYSSWNKILEKDYFTLNNSRYLLISLPTVICKYTMDNLIYNIRLRGYIPIIAHPERTFAMNDPSQVSDLINNDCLIQVDAGSITGLHGDDVKKTVLHLLKHNLVHFVATDAHSSLKNSPRLKEAYAIVSHKFGDNYAKELFEINGAKVVGNLKIKPAEQGKKRSSGLFKKFTNKSKVRGKELVYK